MSVGDGRRYREGAKLYPRTYYPEGTAVSSVCRAALQTAYSYTQHAGRHIGTYVQPVDFQERANYGFSLPSNGLVAASFRAYIPEHWDRIAAHVVWYNFSTVPPQFRIVIDSQNGDWREPEESSTIRDNQHPQLPPLGEFVFAEDIPTLTLPGTFDVSLEGGGTPEADVPFGVLIATMWGVVD